MLEIEKLTKNFGNIQAVDDVSFKVEKGEILSIIGPNGSGKTTIIKLIAGLLKPDCGTINVENSNIVLDPVTTKAKIGYIPDEPSIWTSMTGEEFLHFTGALYGMKEKDRIKYIRELLFIFHLEGIEGRYFQNYSRGNKQKFTILAALLHKPQLLLIDEPIVGLDPASAERAIRKFKEFADNGGAVLLATHTLTIAEEISNRIGILKEGRFIAVGTFEELRAKAELGKETTLEEVYNTLTK